jgi:hypothetical protein
VLAYRGKPLPSQQDSRWSVAEFQQAINEGGDQTASELSQLSVFFVTVVAN